MNEVAQNLGDVSCPTTKAKHKPYPVYCNSGIEWLGDVPEGWEVKRLKHVVCEPLKYGANEAAELDNPALPRYIRITDVNDAGKLREETFKSIPEEIAQPYLLKEGDLLFARSGATVGKNFYYEISWGRAAHAGYLIRARCNPRKTPPRFLNYFASSHNYWQWLSSVFIQATIQNVSAEKYANLVVPLPSFDEQKEIVNFLDEKTSKIDALVEKKKRLIELLKEKRTALINHTVTKGLDPNAKMKASRVGLFGNMPDHWKEKRFGYLVSFNKGLNITKENLQDDGIPCISYGEIHSKYGFEVNPEKDELKYVSETYIESSKNALLKHGDFIFADTSEDIEGSGNFTYYNSNATAFAGYHTIIAKPASNNESRYLAYLFNSPSFRAQIQKEVTGTKVFSITNSILKDAVVLLPPIPEQQAIVSYLDRETSQIDELINKIKSAIDKLKEYRTALISAAVTGKIDVRGN